MQATSIWKGNEGREGGRREGGREEEVVAKFEVVF